MCDANSTKASTGCASESASRPAPEVEAAGEVEGVREFKVVLIEPWYGGSHKVWADSWVANSRHKIDLITLSGQHWRWRMRAGSVELARRFDTYVKEHGRPDAVVISALTDISAFAGLVRRSLGNTPIAAYFHETQTAYPDAAGRPRSDEMILANWRSAEAADVVWFNSQFHRDTFITWLPGVFARQPQNFPTPSDLTTKSRVLYPPVDVNIFQTDPQRSRPGPPQPSQPGPPQGRQQGSQQGASQRQPRSPQQLTDSKVTLLYNQRWDHDKNPRAVISAVAQLVEEGHDIEVILAGENQGHSDIFERGLQRLGPHVHSAGYLKRSEYIEALKYADIVVSAAQHEFFGIAIVEALAAGCVPVLPDALSYPELVGQRWAKYALYSESQFRHKLRYAVSNLDELRNQCEGLAGSMSRFATDISIAASDIAIDELVG